MSALGSIKAQARALLPGDCFLRRDQQLRALFVTDFPRRHPALSSDVQKRLAEGGFSVTEEQGLWRIDLSRDRQLAFLRALPVPILPEVSDDNLPLRSLCRRLLSQGCTDADLQPWEAVKRVILRLDAGELPLLINELSDLCAVYKRKKQPLPTAVVSLLLYHDD